MNPTPFIGLLLCALLFACGAGNNDRYIFFLHNRFLEEHELHALHPEFGRVEYKKIVAAFEKGGFQVISEKRNGNVNAREYALGVVHQIDSLIAQGTEWMEPTLQWANQNYELN